MSLVVSAEVIRALILDGDYLVECLEQRERGCVLLTLTLRSRAQPHSIQIETTENKMEGLFRALLHQNVGRPGSPPALKVGSQPVPVVEVDAMPADQSRRRRRRPAKAEQDTSQTVEVRPPRAARRRAAMRQLTLVSEASRPRLEPSVPQPGKRRGRPNSARTGESL